MTLVGAVQAASLIFDTPSTLDKLDALVEEGAARGAELLVFPEAFVGGYPKGHGFGAVVGMRSDEGREWFRRYHDSAIDLPGEESDRIATAAREHRINLVVGVIERDGGTLYCTVVFYSKDGEALGKHRKLMPTAPQSDSSGASETARRCRWWRLRSVGSAPRSAGRTTCLSIERPSTARASRCGVRRRSTTASGGPSR